MSDLVVGPLLRYVDETSAAVWVEVARRGTVTVVAGESPFEAHTFTVHGHHYALVEVDGLQPGTSTPYTVHLDDRTVWPRPYSPYPPSRIRTLGRRRRTRVLFGSCRTSVPHDPAHNRTHGIDVLRAYALRLPDADDAEWPDLLLLLGDQVYADETSDQMRQVITARRDIEQPPYAELKDYEEYTHIYRLAWSDPAIRWLLSTVPSAMVFDDHDIRDDWNTSQSWRIRMNDTTWWRDRIIGGLGAYWVYQHLGNLSPTERAQSRMLADARRIGREGDAGLALDDFAYQAEVEPTFTRWSFHRPLGGSRLIVLDTRCARILGRHDRRMLDDEEMEWFESLVTGDVDHLWIGTSLPFLLPVGLHQFEAWNEALAGGAWGERAAEYGERMRQAVDLEHWAAFQRSFQRVARLVAAVARGERGAAPSTVAFLSGDVHHSYLAEVDLGEARRGEQSRLLQLVCSPIRNRLPRSLRLASAASARGLTWPMALLVGRSASVPNPPLRWSITEGPWFRNALATLDFEGRRARVTWQTAQFLDGEPDPALVPLRSVTLS
ncbi:MAG TPA: alkaline phosphatase D family protein [Nocardioidaceae bacterium]|nr:alkaline phosphatase D family protein [Nocardioidaceae bacterium]